MFLARTGPLNQIETLLGHADQKLFGSWLRMKERRQATSIVYNADGVDFTIYKTTKPTKSGPKEYWVLVDRSSGKRRLLNNRTLKGAKQRADAIKAAMFKGQADRLVLSKPPPSP